MTGSRRAARRPALKLLCALTVAAAASITGQAGTAHAADEGSLAAAQRATRELRYEAAWHELDVALKRGHHSNRELIALQALRGEVAAIIDGPAVSEAEFRRLLVLAPDHAPPRDTPVFSTPFAQAQRWVANHGHIEIEERRVATPRPGSPTTVAVAVLSDPFAMIVGAHLFYRQPDSDAFTAVAGMSLRPALPALEPGGALEYYVEILDGADNVVAQLGSAEEPLTIEAPAESTPRAAPALARARVAPVELAATSAPAPPSLPHASHPHRVAGSIIGALGIGALAAAIGVDVTGRQQYDQLNSSCAPSCSQSSVDSLHTSEHAAIALYATAGATIATGVILLSIDLARSAHAR